MKHVEDYSDVSPNRAMIAALREADHDLTYWTGRRLISVQLTMKAIANGEEVYVSTKMRPLIATLTKAFLSDH